MNIYKYLRKREKLTQEELAKKLHLNQTTVSRWEKEKSAYFNKKNADKKFYCLEMFSYPSGAKLHAGHWYNYGPTDSYARYKKMKG